MSALEDTKLESTRNVLGALAILTQTSDSVHYQAFVPNFIGGAINLMNKGYVKRSDGEFYELTEEGWEYSRRILGGVGELL